MRRRPGAGLRLESIREKKEFVSALHPQTPDTQKSSAEMWGNMANEKQKCPMCGTKLKMIDGKMACKECGYYMRGQDNMESAPSTAQTNSYSQPAAQTNNYTQPKSTVQQPVRSYTSAGTEQSGSSNKKKNKTGAIAATVAGVIGSIILVVVISLGRSFLFDRLYELWNNMSSNTEENTDKTDTSGNSKDTSNESSTHSSKSDILSRTPQSDFFRQLAEIIFDKSYYEISSEEMASVNALEINKDEYTIYYQVNYETGTSLTFDSSINMSLSDLNCFTGLEWISLIGISLKKGDLDSLENLYAVYSENTLKELADIIPHPENIAYLGTEGSSFFFNRTLEDVRSFPNLEYLTLEDCTYLEDISALEQLVSLKGLYLTKLNDLKDYSIFMKLTGLEELSIQSTQLKSIDFLNVMPNLTYFALEDSDVTNIDALSSCLNLTGLYLMENYSVEDYAPIGELTQLTTLTVFKSTHSPIPSLDKLTALEQAYFKNLWEGELSLVTAAPNISQLYLENSYDHRLELLTSLPLEYLGLVDCSLYDTSLESLYSLPLIQLDMTDSYMWGNIESVFGIPTLEYLCLDRVSCVIDFDNVPDNESLWFLSMNGIKIDTEVYGGLRVPLSGHYDLFEHFPNLERLLVASTDIDTIEFVEKLPYLEYLDITENRVTSLKPLESLPYFLRVDCGGNTILETLPEGSYIYVNTESVYRPY